MVKRLACDLSAGCVLVLALALVPVAAAELLVSTNSSWEFRKGTAEASSPMEAWRMSGYDSRGWEVGRAPFYYDVNGVYTGQTLLGDMRDGYTSVYLRQLFVVEDREAVGTLTLRWYCDDGFVVWINGALVHRYNYSSAGYEHSNRAATSVLEPVQWFGITLTEPGTLLVDGTNWLAIQAFNVTPTSSDFVFDAELSVAAVDHESPRVVWIDPSPRDFLRYGLTIRIGPGRRTMEWMRRSLRIRDIVMRCARRWLRCRF
jgi:hypothetical protein